MGGFHSRSKHFGVWTILSQRDVLCMTNFENMKTHMKILDLVCKDLKGLVKGLPKNEN